MGLIRGATADGDLREIEGSASVIHVLALAVGVTVFWFLSSGYFQVLILSLGAVSSLSVLWIAHRMDVVDHESHPIHMVPKGVFYYPWLFWEIAKANWDVAKAIIAGESAYEPKVMTLKASQHSDVGLVTYANSITLTPGTVTLAVENDTFEIHALTRDAAEGLESGDMDRRASALEGRIAPGTEGAG